MVKWEEKMKLKTVFSLSIIVFLLFVTGCSQSPPVQPKNLGKILVNSGNQLSKKKRLLHLLKHLMKRILDLIDGEWFFLRKRKRQNYLTT